MPGRTGSVAVGRRGGSEPEVDRKVERVRVIISRRGVTRKDEKAAEYT